MNSVTTVTKRDVSRSVFDHSSVTTVTTPYGVSRYVTVILAKAMMVPMPPFLSAGGAAVGGYAFALCGLWIGWLA
jgi:hypothetical protein